MIIALSDLARVGARALGSAAVVLMIAFVPSARSLAQSSVFSPTTMFPTPFSRVVEKHMVVAGELDHRWSVRESYWDHWLILDSLPLSGADQSGRLPKAETDAARASGDGGQPQSGRRRLIDLETGDLVEIDWDSGTFWRSTLRRERSLVRRLEQAEGWRVESSQSVLEQVGRVDETRLPTGALQGTPDGVAVVEDALSRLQADRRLLSGAPTRERSANSIARSVEVRTQSMILQSDRDTDDLASLSSHVVEARVWSDDRVLLSEMAQRALEEQVDDAEVPLSLITMSSVAARARAATGALPLAARATLRLRGPGGHSGLATLTETTVQLDVLGGGARLVNVPAHFQEVAPPLEAVVRRAELERRLDQGIRP